MHYLPRSSFLSACNKGVVDSFYAHELFVLLCIMPLKIGAEELEDSEFDPMFSAVEPELSGKKIALFGSYGWGDGQWMRDWEERAKNAGADLVTDPVMANEAPDDAALIACRELGAALSR